ncbi:MAG TPA: hypothetical protein VF007_10190 [Stellaceae bacterium]
MVRPVLFSIALLAAVLPAAAQPALNPNMSLSAPASAPVQQQMRENYRSQLQQERRELMQQSPSGLSRDQIEIQHQLDLYNSAPRQ